MFTRVVLEEIYAVGFQVLVHYVFVVDVVETEG
jgi:hypothetical protein